MALPYDPKAWDTAEKSNQFKSRYVQAPSSQDGPSSQPWAKVDKESILETC